VAEFDCAAVGTAGASYVPNAGFCNANGSVTTPRCYADFDKSGGVNVTDIFHFLAAWFAASPFARVSTDGTDPNPPTVQDIFRFLAAWFAGCP